MCVRGGDWVMIPFLTRQKENDSDLIPVIMNEVHSTILAKVTQWNSKDDMLISSAASRLKGMERKSSMGDMVSDIPSPSQPVGNEISMEADAGTSQKCTKSNRGASNEKNKKGSCVTQ